MKEKSALRQQNKDTRPTATDIYVLMSSNKSKRVLDIINPTPQTVDALMNLNLSVGVDVKVEL